MKIAIYSDFDSRIKWGLSVSYNILTLFYEHDVSIDLYCHAFNEKYLDFYNVNLNNVILYEHKNKLIEAVYDYDLIILALGGTDNLFILRSLTSSNRPVIVSGFNGLTDGYDIHGLLCRYGSDIICINSQHDYTMYYDALKSLNLETKSLVLSGFQRSYLNSSGNVGKENNTWLFIEQVGIPDTLTRLEYVVDELASVARLNPNIKILIKRRKSKGFLNVNSKNYSHDFKNVWDYKIRNKPKNIYFIDEEVEEILPSVDLCFSFTSSVLLEALALGVKVAVLSDFGIGKKIGNHVFVGSGLFCLIKNLPSMDFTVNDKWFFQYCTINNVVELEKKLQETLRNEKTHIVTYYTEDKYPFYYVRKVNVSYLNKVKRWLLYQFYKIKGIFE